jgi:methyl-accepting chemotaxis protein
MKWFYNMKLTKKLLIASILMSIISGLIGVVGIINLNRMKQNDKILYENMIVPMQNMAEISTLFEKVGQRARDMVIEQRADDINYSYGEIKKFSEQIDEKSNSFASKLLGDEEKALYAEFLTAREAYQKELEKLLSLCLANKDEIATAHLKGMLTIKAVKEHDIIEEMLNLKVHSSKVEYDSNIKTAQTATITMIAFIVFGMVLSIIFGVFLSYIISNPIKKLSTAAELIADGDLNVDIDIDTKDEVGFLANAFKKMSNNLNEVMSNINASSEEVSSGAKQVSESSMILSQGATEQASSIEQLTASIEEISSQTKLNSDNANEASELAEDAKKNAERGNVQMQEMLKAMDDINESSGNISKIIKVIDEIAFQTNILALNAAVEAARAGQHGKGFAVVAEEVRNLAARSANAAKETTVMIEGSIKKVEEGTKIANHTAEALNNIVNGITTVSSLVGNIATASHEQAAGVEQINQGIMQVSTVVQKNSETSEEGAAASEQLSGQAELLKEQVMKFKLKKINRHNSYKNIEHIDPEILRTIEEINQRKKVMIFENYEAEENHMPEKELVANSTRKIDLSDLDFGKY